MPFFFLFNNFRKLYFQCTKYYFISVVFTSCRLTRGKDVKDVYVFDSRATRGRIHTVVFFVPKLFQRWHDTIFLHIYTYIHTRYYITYIVVLYFFTISFSPVDGRHRIFIVARAERRSSFDQNRNTPNICRTTGRFYLT